MRLRSLESCNIGSERLIYYMCLELRLCSNDLVVGVVFSIVFWCFSELLNFLSVTRKLNFVDHKYSNCVDGRMRLTCSNTIKC